MKNLEQWKEVIGALVTLFFGIVILIGLLILRYQAGEPQAVWFVEKVLGISP